MAVERFFKSAVITTLLTLWSASTFADDSPGFLFVNATVTDSEKLGAYGRALPPVYAKYNGQYRIFGGIGRGINVLAGAAQHESVIFAEFESLDAVETFWWSEEYRAVFPLRAGAGQFDVVGIAGTGAEPYQPTGGVQPAYVFTFIKTNDREKAMAYVKATQDLTAKSPGRVIALARPSDVKVLEGPKPDFTIEISSWPSVASFEDYLADPTYVAAVPNRDAAMDVTILIAEVPKPRQSD